MKTIPAILLVDDESDLLDNLCLTLEMAGYETVKARDGIEALRALKSHPIDLIVSDINMPHIGGYQLHKQVRENPRWAAIPFLFLTGCKFLSEAEIRYGQSLGIDGYLIKPIKAEDLLAAVSNKVRV